MTVPTIHSVDQELHTTLYSLNHTHDPDVRRRLLGEMRLLISELDRRVLESTTSFLAATTAQRNLLGALASTRTPGRENPC